MGLFSYLFPKYAESDSDFDRTNVNDGIYQSRSTNSATQSKFSPGQVLPAIILNIAGPIKDPNYFDFASVLEISAPNSEKTQQYYRIHFRVLNGMHENIPLPPSFKYLALQSDSKSDSMPPTAERGSLLKPEAQEELLISCHPSFYVSSEKLQSVIPNPGDKIQITFNDSSFSRATFLGMEEKGFNNLPNPQNFIPLSQSFPETPMKLGDLGVLPFAKNKFNTEVCAGSEDGSLAALSKEIGFLDPYVLVAIRLKESAGDPTAFRFEPHIFIGQGGYSSEKPRNEVKLIKGNYKNYGYKWTSIYIVDNAGKVKKKGWYIPSDATYNPDSHLTYLQQIKPHLDNPTGAVQTHGGIRYAPRSGFFAFGAKKLATYKGKQVTAYTATASYTASFNDNETLHIRDAAFKKAFSIDPTRALKSTSWGKYQVLGWALLRIYDNDPHAALAGFLADPDRVGDMMLKGFFSRFDKKPAMEAVNSDFPNAPSPASWLTFAKLYNGPSCCGGGRKTYDKGIAKKYLDAKSKCDIKSPSKPSVATNLPYGPQFEV
jgi:hypothetical protein